MIKNKIKYLLVFSIFVFVSSCVNVQKKDAKFLANKTATFKNIHNTNLEFLSYISVSKDYSYIIDSPLIVVRIIFPDTTLMTIKGITIAVEFTEKEMYQSFPLLKEGATVLLQEGILIAKDSYYDNQTKKAFKRFTLCRTEECRDVARVSLSYMYKYSSVDPAFSNTYQAGDLAKFFVDKESLNINPKKSVGYFTKIF